MRHVPMKNAVLWRKGSNRSFSAAAALLTAAGPHWRYHATPWLRRDRQFCAPYQQACSTFEAPQLLRCVQWTGGRPARPLSHHRLTCRHNGGVTLRFPSSAGENGTRSARAPTRRYSIAEKQPGRASPKHRPGLLTLGLLGGTTRQACRPQAAGSVICLISG